MEIEFIDSGVYAILNIENENFYVGSETKHKISIAKKGKLKSEEAKSNMRAAWILRKQNKIKFYNE